MSGRTILMTIALSIWLGVSVVAFMVVAYAGFFGVAVFGLLLWFICMLVDLEMDGVVGSGLSPGFLAQQLNAKTEKSPIERAARLSELVLSSQSVRFYKRLGAGLTLIGLAGFALFQI
jgi:hypothetical protein